jgi:predicted acylesterase/phospholipase RssA
MSVGSTIDTAADNEVLPQTAFFVGARGVFQGGGCRGAAHVGAYQAALECGVRLSEVAGTSAGSIIAALIGAGASPEYLRANLLDLDFKRFLVSPRGSEIEHGWISAPLRTIPVRWLVEQFDWGRTILFGGSHSSVAIQDWMDARLAELLPHVRRPIKFRDLLVPTSIVTTDLGEASVKVWSAEDTPGESVALAVRSSCSIPGFFQPVRVGLTMHVDGGILSNLPAFIFARKPTSRSLGGRVLAFSLQDESPPPSRWTLGNVAEQLANTIVGGATELQTRVQPGVHVIQIPTLGVKATDFYAMSKELARALSDSGRRSVIEFIRNEGINLQAEFQRESAAADEDELYADFVREAASPGRVLLVSAKDTLWFWKLFPTILAWRCAGADVRVFLSLEENDESQDWRELQRLTVLEGMGVQIVKRHRLP